MNRLGKDPSIQGLIILIGVMIVLYVIVLPPCDKCKLLGDNCPDTCVEDNTPTGRILLQETPGDLGVVEDEKIRHVFDSANLFVKSGPEVRTLSNSLEIKSGLFGSSDQTLEFTLDDVENLDELTLGFLVTESRGNLILILNGKEIFNQDVNGGNIEEVVLPLEYLEKENKIVLKVSPPGFAFFMTNKYYLKSVDLNEYFEKAQTADLLEFSVSSSERSSLQDSDLHFYVYCKGKPGIANVLKVYLNDNVVFSELIPCISEEHSVDIDNDYFESGVNELEFSVSGGDYLISDIVLTNEVSGKVYSSYTFYISESVYDSDDDFYLFLDMFGEEKVADIIVNDYVFGMDTTNTYKEYDISDKIKKGNNFVEIRPTTEFKIDELRIYHE